MSVLLDLDGTLVDSVYEHVVSWSQALREHGFHVPQWRVHTAIGMGGSRLIPWLLGRHVDEHAALEERHEALFLDRAERLQPTPGARALLGDLDRREVPYVIATSAGSRVRSVLLEALGRPDLDGTDADGVSSSKPAPDLLLEACEPLGTEPQRALMVGDSPWDAHAADRIGLRTIAVRTGGFGAQDLRAAGAVDVVESPRDLVGRL